ncbi:ArsR/SmtB family transcription factor [Propionispora hippei]|uniref:DNA-binding transcriptional regulator, ArsR family n=1 Tax=Propionispora hippei DSM 15287 TaxID=1123003 RepID=A0A1M6G4X5_9FIRM|nr:metalloregulator ArsR/SmtB family transcription factor [Propionispora hippei]SHJ04962.1 DNA-binding transcriptional regulator, ArsR family [Propionispora hippei DSM 15287]
MTSDCTMDTCEELCEHPQVVCLARKDALPETEAQQVAETFKLLGDATRIKMLHALAKRELCVCDLAAVVEMGQSAVSHQLRLLRSARLVKYRKEGKMAWYSLDDTHIESLLAQCVEHTRHR